MLSSLRQLHGVLAFAVDHCEYQIDVMLCPVGAKNMRARGHTRDIRVGLKQQLHHLQPGPWPFLFLIIRILRVSIAT
jgi:hypothetical protein